MADDQTPNGDQQPKNKADDQDQIDKKDQKPDAPAGNDKGDDTEAWKKEKQGILSELTETRKKLKDIEESKTKEEEEKLKEGKKFQELAEKKEQEVITLKNQLAEKEKQVSVKDLASKAGANDTNDVYALIGSQIQVDKDGNVDSAAAQTLIDELKTSKPYLFGRKTNDIGGGSSPADSSQNNSQTFTASQLRDPGFYQKNRDAILKAQKEGKIIQD